MNFFAQKKLWCKFLSIFSKNKKLMIFENFKAHICSHSVGENTVKLYILKFSKIINFLFFEKMDRYLDQTFFWAKKLISCQSELVWSLSVESYTEKQNVSTKCWKSTWVRIVQRSHQFSRIFSIQTKIATHFVLAWEGLPREAPTRLNGGCWTQLERDTKLKKITRYWSRYHRRSDAFFKTALRTQ